MGITIGPQHEAIPTLIELLQYVGEPLRESDSLTATIINLLHRRLTNGAEFRGNHPVWVNQELNKRIGKEEYTFASADHLIEELGSSIGLDASPAAPWRNHEMTFKNAEPAGNHITPLHTPSGCFAQFSVGGGKRKGALLTTCDSEPTARRKPAALGEQILPAADESKGAP